MTIEVKNKMDESQIGDLLNKLKENRKPKGLRKHFGRLIKGLDAVKLQKELRNEWN